MSKTDPLPRTAGMSFRHCPEIMTLSEQGRFLLILLLIVHIFGSCFLLARGLPGKNASAKAPVLPLITRNASPPLTTKDIPPPITTEMAPPLMATEVAFTRAGTAQAPHDKLPETRAGILSGATLGGLIGGSLVVISVLIGLVAFQMVASKRTAGPREASAARLANSAELKARERAQQRSQRTHRSQDSGRSRGGNSSRGTGRGGGRGGGRIGDRGIPRGGRGAPRK
nr:uncharacterized protein LOC110089450 [Pogona vitticeps]